MTHAIQPHNPNSLPTDAATGLILPLSKSLGSRDLAQHRAVVAVELEVLAKKLDRFGWERDRNSPAHDRTLLDWMDALQDFPIDEIRAACRAAVIDNPNKMPNEGHVVAQIMAARAKAVAARKRAAPPMEEPRPQPTPEERARVSEYAATLLRGFGQTNKGEA